jgi:hypothetical protein
LHFSTSASEKVGASIKATTSNVRTGAIPQGLALLYRRI